MTWAVSDGLGVPRCALVRTGADWCALLRWCELVRAHAHGGVQFAVGMRHEARISAH